MTADLIFICILCRFVVKKINWFQTNLKRMTHE